MSKSRYKARWMSPEKKAKHGMHNVQYYMDSKCDTYSNTYEVLQKVHWEWKQKFAKCFEIHDELYMRENTYK